jgi:hypothetical protein
MAALSEPIPLRDHRACLQQYLRGIAFAADSVAGRIIEERLPGQYARDPIRPGLVLWACAAAGGEVADALPVAAAFELFDRFLLLHDELANDSLTVARWGLGQSLNAGDALYALAFRSLATGACEPKRRLVAARLVGEAVLEALAVPNDDLARSIALTGAALQAGAVLAGAAESVARTFAEVGRLLPATPQAAVERMRASISRRDLESFEEIARYVARRAA